MLTASVSVKILYHNRLLIFYEIFMTKSVVKVDVTCIVAIDHVVDLYQLVTISAVAGAESL